MATTKSRKSGLAGMLPDIRDALSGVPTTDAPVEQATEPETAPRDVAPASKSRPSPAFEAFERKEARLRQKQLDDLEALRKQINRSKTSSGGERITDNTLIRVAVDLLLDNAGKLRGATELELRKSVGL